MEQNEVMEKTSTLEELGEQIKELSKDYLAKEESYMEIRTRLAEKCAEAEFICQRDKKNFGEFLNSLGVSRPTARKLIKEHKAKFLPNSDDEGKNNKEFSLDNTTQSQQESIPIHEQEENKEIVEKTDELVDFVAAQQEATEKTLDEIKEMVQNHTCLDCETKDNEIKILQRYKGLWREVWSDYGLNKSYATLKPVMDKWDIKP